MKSIPSIALALATALTVPVAMADNEVAPEPNMAQPKSKCVPPVGEQCPQAKKAAPKQKEAAVEPETPTPEPTTEPASAPDAVGGGPADGVGGGPVEQEPMPAAAAPPPPMPDTVEGPVPPRMEQPPHVRRGLGLNAIGSLGFREDARWGLGGRVEYVFGFGLTVGGSYQVHWVSEGDTTQVRPLLGEIGWAFAPVRHLEIRPMVGLGWAFVDAARTTYTNDAGQTINTRAVVSDGFDVAPGAKISFVEGPLEIFTVPKYHFITGNNFAAIELGAGVRL